VKEKEFIKKVEEYKAAKEGFHSAFQGLAVAEPKVYHQLEHEIRKRTISRCWMLLRNLLVFCHTFYIFHSVSLNNFSLDMLVVLNTGPGEVNKIWPCVFCQAGRS
jgi:hypothetical protein